MEDKLTAAAEKYERRIKIGFPAGELKAELLAEGYTEEEALLVIEKTNEIIKSKTKKATEKFSVIIVVPLLLAGLFMLYLNIKSGWWFIISALLKLGYNFFIYKETSE